MQTHYVMAKWHNSKWLVFTPPIVKHSNSVLIKKFLKINFSFFTIPQICLTSAHFLGTGKQVWEHIHITFELSEWEKNATRKMLKFAYIRGLCNLYVFDVKKRREIRAKGVVSIRSYYIYIEYDTMSDELAVAWRRKSRSFFNFPLI